MFLLQTIVYLSPSLSLISVSVSIMFLNSILSQCTATVCTLLFLMGSSFGLTWNQFFYLIIPTGEGGIEQRAS